ncbi:SelB C-terminal domain-containing protein, partial [Comamonas sp.]
ATADTAPLLAEAPLGLARSQLVRLTGTATPAVAENSTQLPLPDGDALLVDRAAWQTLQDQLLQALQRFHALAPDEPGINAARLRRMALPALQHGPHDALYHGLLDALIATGQIASSGAWLHLPGHTVQLSDAEQALAQRLLPAITESRFDPPWVRDLARDHGAGEEVVRQLLKKLSRQGLVFQVVKDLFYAAPSMDALAALTAELAQQAERGEVQAHVFRDATALGRKRAIQILEFFDRVGYTRRVRDTHVLRPGVRWQAGTSS